MVTKEELKTEIKDVRAEIKDVRTEMKEFLLWGFGMLFGGMGMLMGFVIWDRRTALAPAIKKYKELEEKEELIEKALKRICKGRTKTCRDTQINEVDVSFIKASKTQAKKPAAANIGLPPFQQPFLLLIKTAHFFIEFFYLSFKL